MVLWGNNPSLRVYNNVLTRNKANHLGGDLFSRCKICDANTNEQIYNNTFTFGSAPEAGGVYIGHSCVSGCNAGTDDPNGDAVAGSVAFWNNISYLTLRRLRRRAHTTGPFHNNTDGLAVRAFNSIVGTTADLGICDPLDVCINATRSSSTPPGTTSTSRPPPRR